MRPCSHWLPEHLAEAFKPKTKVAYVLMFKLFVAFCVIVRKPLSPVDLKVVLSYMECLAFNYCSAGFMANLLSALKTSFVVYSLPFQILLFLKSLKINRPLSLTPLNIIDVPMITRLSAVCDDIYIGQVFKSMFYASHL